MKQKIDKNKLYNHPAFNTFLSASKEKRGVRVGLPALVNSYILDDAFYIL